MNILFTLCGRAGSKGVKGKNARDFLGIPLAWYSLAGIKMYIDQYVTSKENYNIVLNTDSEDLINIVKNVKDLDVTIFRRDDNLAGDRVPKVSVILDCLTRAESAFGLKYDVVVDLDITSPLRKIVDIKNAIDRKMERDDVDVVYTVVPCRRNPYFNMAKEENGYFGRAFTSNFVSRQEAPAFYDKNASIYVYSPDALRNKNHVTFFNDKCDATLMFDTGILDIDSEEDYYLMQVIAKYLFENMDGFKDVYKTVLDWSDKYVH